MKKIYLILLLSLMVTHPVWASLSTYAIQEAYSKSYSYEKAGNYSESIKILNNVFETYPDTYTINLRLGYLYYRINRITNALDHYDKAIQASPSSIEAKTGKMWVLLTQERYSEAEKLGTQIVSTDPYNYYGNLRLAYILRLQKKNEAAEAIHLKMLGAYPTDIAFLNEYATLKFYAGDYAKASSLVEAVLTLDPDNKVAKGFESPLKKALSSGKK